MYQDLTGQRFGRWSVINYSYTKNRKSYWKCRCNCGNESVVRSDILKSGASQSCGCYNLERIKEVNFIDLVGKKFGRLDVIELSHKKDALYYWKCYCECGNETIVSGANLRNGETQSCGCLHREIVSEFQNLIGMRFDRLIVIELSHKNGHVYYWLCKCDCGKTKIIRGSSLKNGTTKSCGCYKLELFRNRNWKDGSSKLKYPDEWTEELKESIRNRDDRKCQFQDCTYDDTREKMKLHIHHIDGEKNNCEPYNLISLCGSHHQFIEHTNPELWIDYFYQITGDFRWKQI